MNSKNCVNCGNKNPVNGTDNRLVTESCGHVKCMHCLLHEKAGCVACKVPGNDNLEELNPEVSLTVENEVVVTDDSEPLAYPTLTLCHRSEDVQIKEAGKLKLDTSHIILQDGIYTCTICKKKFNARSQVTYHAYCNGQSKPYHCQECNKSFSMRAHYYYHMQSHTKDRPYTCEVCGANFIVKSKLQRHKLRHTKEKNYTCGDCNKAFNNMSALRKHALIHSGERPYVCPTCDFRFRDSSNYRKHLRTKHSDKRCVKRCGGAARRHHCTRCSQAFALRKDLLRHMLVHSDTKDYVCKVAECGAQFRRKDNYDRHVRNSHSDKRTGDAKGGSRQNRTTISEVTHKKTDEVCEKNKLQVLNPLPPLPEEVMQKHLNGQEEKLQISDNNATNNKTNNTQSQIKDVFNCQNKTLSQANDLLNCESKTQTNELVNCQNRTQSQAIELFNCQNKTQSQANNLFNGQNKTQSQPKDLFNCQNKTQTQIDRVIDKSYIIEANHARESVIVSKYFDRKVPSPVTEYVHKIRKANLCNKEVPLPPIDEKKFLELTTKDRNCLDIGPLPKNIQTYKSILHDKSGEDGKIPEVHWRKKRLTDKE